MIRTEIVDVTPDIARSFLTKNTANYRVYRPRIAQKYADDMINGRWKTNGESICFNEKGQLVDGQHRLNAIIMSGVTVQMVVVYGIAGDVSTFDVGLARNAVDIARVMDDSVFYNTNVIGIAGMFISDFRRVRVTLQSTADYAVRNHDLIYEASKMCRVSGKNGYGISRNSGSGIAAYLWAREYGASILVPFFSVVNSGYQTDGFECSPAITIRN